MVAFAANHDPGTDAVEPENRVGNFFVDVPDCAGLTGSGTRTVAGENVWFSYDERRSVSLDQGGHGVGDSDEERTLGQRMISGGAKAMLAVPVIAVVDTPAPGPADVVAVGVGIVGSAVLTAGVVWRGVEIVTELASRQTGNQRLTRFIGVGDQEIMAGARDRSLSSKDRRDYQTEEKARGLRNKNKERGQKQ